MKVIGLTGGIGMGKSTAEEWLRRQGMSVADTDVFARQIVQPGQPALREIQKTFGNAVMGADGQLQRAELAKIVFSAPAARRKLESITHPRIRELWKKQVKTWRQENKPAAVVVIPLLFETQAETEFDEIICVACSAATQARRLAGRGWSAAHIQQRVSAQWPVEIKIARAQYLVWTEGGLDVTNEQLKRIFSRQM